MGLIIKFFGIGIAVIVVIYMLVSVFRRARKLDTRIQAFKAENEEITRQRGPINPYAALSDLYQEREAEQTTHKSKKNDAER